MRTVHRANRIITPKAARDRARTVEQLRQNLPVDAYLTMLHLAATTGVLPHLDPYTHKPTGTGDPISPPLRHETITYLLDKALPDYKRLEPIPDDGAGEQAFQDVGANPANLRAMSTDQIMALVESGKGILDAQFSQSPAAQPSTQQQPATDPTQSAGHSGAAERGVGSPRSRPA
jgi:hypothetical protein